MCGNSAEVIETEGNSAGKKQRHENEFIYNMEFSGNEGTEGNQWPPTKNSSNLRNIWGVGGHNFSWPRIFN